jgi:DNA-binding response OmpR family regulator
VNDVPSIVRLPPRPRRRILLVERDPDLAAGFAEILQRTGAMVLRAESDARAIRILEGVAVDVVVADLDGQPPDLIERVARRSATHSFAFVVLARAACPPRIDERHQATISVLPKPIAVETLLSTIAAIPTVAR